MPHWPRSSRHPPPAAAQDPTDLEGLVVTAHRRAAPAWTVAAHTTVIEGAELRRAGIEYVADALRRVPGTAVVRNGSFGASTTVHLRGSESDYVQCSSTATASPSTNPAAPSTSDR